MTKLNSHVVLFNGPPRSGKDTYAQHLVNTWNKKALSNQPEYRAVHYKMVSPADEAIKMLFSISNERHRRLREEMKDDPVPELFGYSYRETLISYIEGYLKPRYGQEVFGLLAENKLLSMPEHQIVVISDIGFEPALNYLTQHTFRQESCLLIRLHREGHTFSTRNDSRSYVYSESIWSEDIYIRNGILAINKVLEVVDSFCDTRLASYD
jgi:hypothetical protein